MSSEAVESMKIPGASGWFESTEMMEGTSRGVPYFSRMGRQLVGVSGEAGRGRERDWRELAIRMRVKREERGEERSWARIERPTPPRPMRATGRGRATFDMARSDG